MNVCGISRVLFYFAFLQNVVTCANWVNDVTKYVSQRSELRVVHFITNHGEHGDIRNPQIDELLISMMQKLPTQRIDFDKDFKLPSTLVHDGRKTPFDTSAALFILVIESRDVLRIPPAKRFLGAVADLTSNQTSSKLLMVTSARKPSDDLEELLQYGWTKRILDLTIIELIESNEVPRYAMAIDRPITSHVIKHQLNPFKKEYTQEPWTSDIDKLFPKKTKDLHGFPLKVATLAPTTLPACEDFESLFRSIIQERLNCSLLESHASFPENPNFYAAGIKVMLELENMELISTLFPNYPGAWMNFDRTVTATVIESSFMVPIFHTHLNWVSKNFVGACCLIFAIILVFWALMRLLGYESYPWRVFNIGRVLFGVGISHQPRGKFERIIFGCLLCISAFYSSALYTSITNILFQTVVQTKFESFEDLMHSELPLCVKPYDLPRISDIFIGPLKVLRNRTIMSDDINMCAVDLEEFKNVSCLLDKIRVDFFVGELQKGGQPVAMIAKPSVWMDAYSFIIARRSPYRSSFDDIILRLQNNGLINKYCDTLPPDNVISQSPTEFENSEDLFRQLMKVAFVGYSLSIIVLIAEILVYRIFMCKKSKKPFIHKPLYPYSERKASRKKKNKPLPPIVHQPLYPYSERKESRKKKNKPPAPKVGTIT